MPRMTREERFLMKERMKEHRHQAKMAEIRRKRELAEIKNSKIRTVGNFLSKNSRFIIDVLLILLLAACLFLPVGYFLSLAKR